MPNPTFRAIESGPAFETYQWQGGAMRLDWTGGGAVRGIYFGHVWEECADAIIVRWQVAVRQKQQITHFHDTWGATGYEGAVRVKLTDFAKKHAASFVSVNFLSSSKIVNMAVSVVSLALPTMNIKGYGNRAEFDALCKKCGLLTNPPVPAPGTT
jgi:hypothetical protein